MNPKRMTRLLKKEVQKKRMELFESGHKGRKKGRCYAQLIEIEDDLNRKQRTRTRRA
jgi:hypothetical protein